MHLDVIHLGTTTNANQRNTVDLVTRGELIATFSHDNVVQDTTTVVGVVAASKT